MLVEYVAHSGDDLLVVDCARASFGKQSSWEVVDERPEGYLEERLSTKDTKLINYLAREKHVLPFRHPTITLRCKAPIFVARQLMKHQAGMSWSEESRRYITTEPEFYLPDKWRKKADNVKQGSSDEQFIGYVYHEYGSNAPTEFQWGVDQGPEKVVSDAVEHCLNAYDAMIYAGIAPEQARMILPQNMYSTWVWTGTLLSWIHMLQLRLDAHTQKETQEFAGMVRDIIQPLYPVSYAALMEN